MSYISLCKDKVSDFIGILVDNDAKITVWNPKTTKNAKNLNFFFPLSKTLMDDVVTLTAFTEINGGGNFPLTTFDAFNGRLLQVLPGMIPIRSMKEMDNWYKNICKYNTTIYDSKQEACVYAILAVFGGLAGSNDQVVKYKLEQLEKAGREGTPLSPMLPEE